jgi:anionic cell wall polymer biosynthesis LytR-Cps2A-Psr (LCP) family protein
MFAFIDIVDILGGIDITLDEDLVDPTYKVRNNGIWSTLYYKKGNYHLDGVETLRIARARHYTPAFSRDDRQQRIIISLINKASQLSVTDFEKIYSIIKTIITYLDTDISFGEIINLMNTVKSVDRFTKTILSTHNVLDQTYSNLLYLEKNEKDIDEDFDKGAWILVPKEDNWDLIPSFISKRINNSEILD